MQNIAVKHKGAMLIVAKAVIVPCIFTAIVLLLAAWYTGKTFIGGISGNVKPYVLITSIL